MNRTTKFGIKSTQDKIKIGDLAILADISKSTIHHYLKLGILHPPLKLGPKKSAFDSSHLIKLNRIKELRQQDRLPLSKIKQVLSNETKIKQDDEEKIYDTALMIRKLEDKKKNTKTQKDDIRRLQIIDAAIALFSKIGYEKTTLDAIAESLHIAKSTVYLYFENKDQLLMKCIDRLVFVAVPKEQWEDIRKEKDFLLRLKKRALAFHSVFPNYRGILTLIKASLGSENQEMSERAKNALFMMTKPMRKDIRRAISAGVFKDLNEDIISHLLLSMGEGIGFRMMVDSQYTAEEAIDIMFRVISHGILKDPSFVKEIPCESYYSAEITDKKENTTMLKKVLFNKRTTLAVSMGDATVNLFMNKIEWMTFSKNESTVSVQIKDLDNRITNAELIESPIVSGIMPFGEFSIDLRHVKRIVFNHTATT
jgi:AcrR family transcriptional regulator/predicted DNA-binding transcriptional regulator AlpA